MLVMLTSCGPPEFGPEIGPGPLPIKDLVRRADVVVVGTITSQVIVATPIPGKCLFLTRANVAVESVLRGDVGADSLAYYYFDTWCATSGPVDLPRSGTRSIFFLRKDGGHWRPIGDYWRNRIPVLSGRHARNAFSGEPIGEAIAKVLLTTGEDCRPDELVEALSTTPRFAAVGLLGAERTSQLMEPLLNYPDAHLRVAACAAITESLGAHPCAKDLVVPYLDRLERGEFDGMTNTFLSHLRSLSQYTVPLVRKRAQMLLPIAETMARAPDIARPALPAALRTAVEGVAW